MASREQFLEDYEIRRLLCDSDDSEDYRYSDDDIGLRGSDDEEDDVEEGLDDDIDCVCTMLLTMVTMESWKTQMMSVLKQENAQTRRGMFFKTRIIPGAGHLPKLLELAERTYQCVLPGVWTKQKLQIPHMMLFHFLFLIIF